MNMNKKFYISPKADAIIVMKSSILLGSTPGGGSMNGDPVEDGGAAKGTFGEFDDFGKDVDDSDED